MLELAGTGEAAVLGHVADQHDRNPGLLGGVNQPRRGLPHLGDAAGGTAHLAGLDRLYRIHDQQVGRHLSRRGDDLVHVSLGSEQHPG